MRHSWVWVKREVRTANSQNGKMQNEIQMMISHIPVVVK